MEDYQLKFSLLRPAQEEGWAYVLPLCLFVCLFTFRRLLTKVHQIKFACSGVSV